MRLSLGVTLAVAAVGTCHESYDQHFWRPASPHDRRSPCPMLNTLANHGFLRRTGLNISVDELVDGLDIALNLSPLSSRPVAELAATTSTTGYSNTFNLDDLSQHGVIEHDASLSRNDAYFGDNHSFNPAIFATTVAHWRKPFITIEVAAKTRTDRIAAARAVNPEFTFGPDEDRFSQFASALYLRVFGHGTAGFARTKWVEVLFREERLPYREGFRRSDEVLLNEEIVELADKVAAASPVEY